MRLAQIARKVGMTPTDIKRFLESEFELNIGKEPNYKLDDNQVDAVLEKFPLIEVEEVVESPQKVKNSIADKVEEETQSIEEEAVDETEEIVIELEEIVGEQEAFVADEDETQETVNEAIEKVSTTTGSRVEINYDDEGEPINETPTDFKEVEVDPDAEIIEAPKVKLDGLKVLGKIELPEDKKVVEEEKSEEEIEAEEADEIATLEAAMQSQVQDVKAAKVVTQEAKATLENTDADEEAYSEYKDDRGVYHYSLSQKENRAKALAEIELKRKAIQAKEKKKRHYEALMKEKKAKALANKKETATVQKPKPKKVKKQEEVAPKGLWSKFVHWLND